jgi:hypothetical protein
VFQTITSCASIQQKIPTPRKFTLLSKAKGKGVFSFDDKPKPPICPISFHAKSSVKEKSFQNIKSF